MNCRCIVLSCLKTDLHRLKEINLKRFSQVHYLSKFENLPLRKKILVHPNKNHNLCSEYGYLQTYNFWSVLSRGYAKGKDKKKGDKGKKNVTVDESSLGELIDLEKLKNQMQKNVEIMKEEYVKNLSLRSTTGSFETLKVKLEGTEHTLQELAQIIRKNPKTIVVNMSSFPQAIPSALEAIQKSGMNLNPQQDGTTLYIPVPKVTKEHREALSKNAKALFIKCRDSLRDVQNKCIKSLKHKENVSSDAVFSAQQQITSLCNTYISQAEKIMETKQMELVGKD